MDRHDVLRWVSQDGKMVLEDAGYSLHNIAGTGVVEVVEFLLVCGAEVCMAPLSHMVMYAPVQYQ